MIYNAVIIDDEKDAIDLLKEYITLYFPQIRILGSAQYPDEIIPVLSNEPVDLLFLDVKLKGITGFDVLEKVSLPKHVFVIFVTAYENYAFQAFNHNASGYLVKPVTPRRFKEVIQKSLEQIDALKALSGVQKVMTEKFAIPQGKNFKVSELSQIVFCQSEGSYTLFFLIGNKKITATRSLSEIERNLEKEGFIRVHQSYLVNKKHMVEFDPVNRILTVSNQSKIPVSRRQKKTVKALFQNGILR